MCRLISSTTYTYMCGMNMSSRWNSGEETFDNKKYALASRDVCFYVCLCNIIFKLTQTDIYEYIRCTHTHWKITFIYWFLGQVLGVVVCLVVDILLHIRIKCVRFVWLFDSVSVVVLWFGLVRQRKFRMFSCESGDVRVYWFCPLCLKLVFLFVSVSGCVISK